MRVSSVVCNCKCFSFNAHGKQKQKKDDDEVKITFWSKRTTEIICVLSEGESLSIVLIKLCSNQLSSYKMQGLGEIPNVISYRFTAGYQRSTQRVHSQ